MDINPRRIDETAIVRKETVGIIAVSFLLLNSWRTCKWKNEKLMLTKSDPKKEEKILEKLIESDPKIKDQHERFVAEMEFKQQLIDIRSAEALTQKEIGNRTGLSQQAVSRLERGTGTTIETVIKYLSSMGYRLGIEKMALK